MHLNSDLCLLHPRTPSPGLPRPPDHTSTPHPPTPPLPLPGTSLEEKEAAISQSPLEPPHDASEGGTPRDSLEEEEREEGTPVVREVVAALPEQQQQYLLPVELGGKPDLGVAHQPDGNGKLGGEPDLGEAHQPDGSGELEHEPDLDEAHQPDGSGELEHVPPPLEQPQPRPRRHGNREVGRAGTHPQPVCSTSQLQWLGDDLWVFPRPSLPPSLTGGACADCCPVA